MHGKLKTQQGQLKRTLAMIQFKEKRIREESEP